MAFNAGLNRISIEDASSGENIDIIARLRSLLKDEKNKNFVDQIYYRIGDAYLDRNENHSAIESYNTAIRLSTNNQNQKGLSYLRIADIYFKNGDYVAAKAYYDSTLSTLSPSFPGYDIISRKGNNLELLANRYRIIGREDTLQILARLSEEERNLRIGALVREQLEKTQQLSQNNSAPESMIAAIDNPGTLGGTTEGKFYFNNTTAISQGLSDFKRRWGNRTLEDNWRRSGKTASEALTSVADNAGTPTNGNMGSSTGILTPEVLENSYRNNIPLTDSALQASNQRIADSYYDIASFYRDELKDRTEAINAFEELLSRAPESSYKLSVYYNLYRLYSGLDEQKSEKYKNLILSGYPESPFARVIVDPDYSRKSNEKEAALNNAYNEIYDLYTEKKYSQVIQGVQSIESKYGINVLSPQLAYLNALAVGHTQKLPPFESGLQKIVSDFPADKLITPLVQQHLSYINTNRSLFEDRPTALTEHNPFELLLTEPEPVVIAQNNQNAARQTDDARKPVTQPVQKQVQDASKSPVPERSVPARPVPDPDVNQPAVQQPLPGESTGQPSPQNTVDNNSTAQPVPQPSVKPEEVQPTPAPVAQPQVDTPKPKPLFDLPPVGEYYFVINVQDPAANLNSSRFGIGQFNRTRFSGTSIKHQLKEVNNENQLIFIGPFDNYDSAKYYERGLLALIKDIMKVPAEKYNTFVIVKQELDNLTNSTQINAYLEFYKNSR
nr:tetratricopeptide repeat protein [Pedobacter xinjiangensis]